MAGAKQLDLATGYRLLDTATGAALTNASDDCCCAPTPPCEFVDSCPSCPTTVTMVAAGVNAALGFVCADGTYTMTMVEGTCEWQAPAVDGDGEPCGTWTLGCNIFDCLNILTGDVVSVQAWYVYFGIGNQVRAYNMTISTCPPTGSYTPCEDPASEPTVGGYTIVVS